MSDTLEPGTLVDGKYVVEGIVGSGGMGTVYEAVQTDVDRRVALKVLNKIDDGSAVSRFQREARAAGRIGHDNVCEVTDFGTDENGVAYLVMPLLGGCSFGALIQRPEGLTGRRIVDICLQTLSALEAAHERDIVHRDLKPDNLFITRVGDREDFVKLLDFGISKYLGPEAVTNLTRTGLIPGTPLYMAPEQAAGKKQLDHRIDIYSLGVILYEAFTGERPFEGDSYNEILIKIVSKPFKNPRMINPDIPQDVEQVITKAMARNPNLRFADAGEMREALKRLDPEALEKAYGTTNGAGEPPADGDTTRAPLAAAPFAVGGQGQEMSPRTAVKRGWKRVAWPSLLVVAVIHLLVVLFGLPPRACKTRGQKCATSCREGHGPHVKPA